MVEGLKKSKSSVIFKPRNLYSRSALRVAVGDIDLEAKKTAISMSKITMKSALRIGEPKDKERKVKTFSSIPKIVTLMGMKKKRKGKDDMTRGVGLAAGEEDEKENKDGGGKDIYYDSSESGSSVDGGDQQEIEAYNAILVTQAVQKKNTDDLIDKELKDLLKICKTFAPPT